jgi:multidrug efflux pump subunit AcrA (membrane-fusion protein)
VREISPTSDRSTGSVRVKIGLDGLPRAFTLGAPVTGSGHGAARWLATLPPGALAADQGQPAVWVIDPLTRRVALRRIEIERYESDALVVRGGLKPGDLVVTAGTQLLRPQQLVAVAAPK